MVHVLIPRTRYAVLVFVLALFGAYAPCFTASAGDPELEFSTIETEHFRIHFHQGLERVARLAASICEEVHEDLTIMFGWEVNGPTHVVIIDTTDAANGVTYVQHRPRIVLRATAPNAGSSLQTYDHYLRMLFIHEYTHMVSLRIHSGVSRVINAIFGDVYFPNQMSPTWYHEAITVLEESYQTSGGRVRSAFYPMVLRTAALEGTLLSLDQVSNYSRQFPRGTAFYLYGGMFFAYLRARFGIEKIVEIYHRYGAKPIPWGINRTFKEVFGTDLVQLYEEWQQSVREEAAATEKRLTALGLTESTPLTADGETKGRPIFSPDGQSILLPNGTGMDYTGVYRIPLDGSPPRLIVRANTHSHITLDNSGRLFFTRAAPYKHTHTYNDVFMLEAHSTEPQRLTFGARSWAAAVSPRGDRLVMATNQAGTTKLVLADDRGNQLATLIDSPPDDQVYSPVWSPDGSKIAMLIRRGPQLDLALIDMVSGELHLLTEDRALENAPAFDPTGRYLVYMSDRTGVRNIYARDLVDDTLYQLTNVLTGADMPAVSPDGQTLAFVKYSSTGFDLHLMPFRPQAARRVTSGARSYEPMRPLPAPSTAPIRPYNPLPTLLPSYWNLTWATNTQSGVNLQALTAFTDVVGRHSIGAQIDLNTSAPDQFAGRIGYAYTGLRPGIHLSFARSLAPRDEGYIVEGESRKWTQTVTRGRLSLSFPFRNVDHNHNLSFGYNLVHARTTDVIEAPLDPTVDRPSIPRQYFRGGLDAGWSFRDTVSSPLGIAPHKGRTLSANLELYHPTFGGSQTLATVRYGWSEHFRLPWLDHHTLTFQLHGGAHISDPPHQSSFSAGGYAEQNVLDAIWNDASGHKPSLRGYARSAFQGSQYQGLRLSYYLPVWFTEAGYATLPVYLRRVQAEVFSDNVAIAYDEFDLNAWRSSAGFELTFHLIMFYFSSMSIRTGYAYGLMEGGIHEFVMVIGKNF